MSDDFHEDLKKIIEYLDMKGAELGGEYSDYEQLAISTLDSRWDEFPPGILEGAMHAYLLSKEHLNNENG